MEGGILTLNLCTPLPQHGKQVEQIKYIFIGQNPSKHNIDGPFVGSQSGVTLFKWLEQMKIPTSQIIMVNACDKLGAVTMKDVNINNLKVIEEIKGCRVVCLGALAEKALKKAYPSKPYFKLPHPSGLNRVLNNKKHVDELLKKCKMFLERGSV